MTQTIQLDHSHHINSNIKFPLCYLAHNIDDPANIGSFFRIADAMGVSRIILTGTSPVPPDKKIKRASRSTENYVEYFHHKENVEVIKDLRREGYTIVTLEITSTSVDIRCIDFDKYQKICLVLGSEKNGVDQYLLSQSDYIVHIPMLGKNSSMNVASACAIATFEIIKKRF